MSTNHPSVDQSDRLVPINLRQSGRTPVEMLIDTRIRKSPYWQLSAESGCWRASVYNRMYHPRGYVRPEDGGAMVEYDSLVNHVTMWNVAVERQIQVKGPGAADFVNFVITRDATKIPPMRARYVILCTEAGGILNDPVLLRIAEDEYWFSLSDSDLMFWLQGVNVGRRFDVERFLRRLAPTLARDESVVAGLHVFTFNQVAATEAWRARLLAQLREGGADPRSSPSGPETTR